MKLSSVKYLVGQGIKNVWTNRVMSFASFCVLMVSLLLVGLSALFMANINRLVGGIENRNEVIIFMNDDSTDEQIQSMGDTLKTMDNISSVSFYSKEQAWEDYKNKMGDAEEIFNYITDNPLPDSYRIRVADISIMTETVTKISRLDNVYEIDSPDDFANLLTEVRSTVAIISTTILVALVVVCMVIISNSTRASVFSRRKEINIMKYVGATNSFIRIPFFVEGMFTGALAGTFAALITWFGYDSLIDVLSQEMTMLNILGVKDFISFSDVAFKVFAAYILSGAFLGALGSVISTRKHLKV